MPSNLQLIRPDLNTVDIIKIHSYVKTMGYQLIIDQQKRKYLVIRENTVGFIQKVENHLFVIFKDGTRDNINKIASISLLFDKYNITPEDKFDFSAICKIVKHGKI